MEIGLNVKELKMLWEILVMTDLEGIDYDQKDFDTALRKIDDALVLYHKNNPPA